MLVSRVALVCLVSCLIFQVVAGIHHHGGGGGGLGILLGVGLLAKLLEGHHHSHHHHHHHVKYVPIPVFLGDTSEGNCNSPPCSLTPENSIAGGVGLIVRETHKLSHFQYEFTS
ncbi:hypothetical protein AVEN_54402-1 [Araneus ventricosus]|uniref:Uncharacterized protein n=1 Tax=Araneus ventricosus TaxID=182803 RepID=A0A4Y2D9L3_ARAVE|nr:hypothetical protein AVEN_54402-1 [Araneus ventricosus]